MEVYSIKNSANSPRKNPYSKNNGRGSNFSNLLLLIRLKGHTKPFDRSLNELFWGVLELCSLANDCNNVRISLKRPSMLCEMSVARK